MTANRKTSFDYSIDARRWLEASGDEAISKPAPGLYIVATPIGNLGDITLRALRTLAGVDAVACEDTRVTGALLHRYGIKKPLISYHDHNADKRRPGILARLAANEAIALVSDAGTPLLSDPGFKLVQACRAEGYAVTALPGASALLAALCSAGLPMNRFMFAGFLPPKQTARHKFLAGFAAIDATLVFYDSPARLADALNDMAQTYGATRPAAVARELTKLFEEVRPATLGALAAHYRNGPPPKGEIVILVGPPEETATKPPAAADIDTLLKKNLRTMSLRDAVAHVTEKTGLKKSEVYKRALRLGEKRK